VAHNNSIILANRILVDSGGIAMSVTRERKDQILNATGLWV